MLNQDVSDPVCGTPGHVLCAICIDAHREMVFEDALKEYQEDDGSYSCDPHVMFRLATYGQHEPCAAVIARLQERIESLREVWQAENARIRKAHERRLVAVNAVLAVAIVLLLLLAA